MFEVVYSHIRSIDIVNENYLTNNYEPNKTIFSVINYSLRIHTLRRRKHLYQTASGDKDVEERPFLSQQTSLSPSLSSSELGEFFYALWCKPSRV